MRTTVDIRDDLIVEAKKLAAERRVPLRVLIEEGLRVCLEGRAKGAKAQKKIRWVAVEGELPEGLRLEDREAMHDWLRGAP